MLISFKSLVLLMVIVCMLRGLLMSDFRYGLISIGIIQVFFPLSVSALSYFFLRKRGHFYAAAGIGLTGILAAQVIALIMNYRVVGMEGLTDPVSASIYTASTVLQVAIFLAALCTAKWLWKTPR